MQQLLQKKRLAQLSLLAIAIALSACKIGGGGGSDDGYGRGGY